MAAFLLTHNARDFTLLHHAWRRWPRDWGIRPLHAGILILPQSLHLPAGAITFHAGALLATNWDLSNELYLFKGVDGGWVKEPEPPERG